MKTELKIPRFQSKTELEIIEIFKKLNISSLICQDCWIIKISSKKLEKLKALGIQLEGECTKTNLELDHDIKLMTEDDAKKKLQEIRNVCFWWTKQERNDKCWLDDIKLMKTILPHGKVNLQTPGDLEFIQNCISFKQNRCPSNKTIEEW